MSEKVTPPAMEDPEDLVLKEVMGDHFQDLSHIPAPAPKGEKKPEPVYQPAPVQEKPAPVVKIEEEVIPVPAAQIETKPAPVQPVQPAAPVYDKDSYIQEQFNGIGLDLNAYSDIPETLQKEKESLFSTLEFGIEDSAKKKGKFKRR